MKIYTRTGDGGQTGLVGGTRVSKTDLRISAIGDVDELNAAMGLAIAGDLSPDIHAECLEVQNRLFDIGSDLASPRGARAASPQVTDEDVSRLEASMDAFSEELPPLREFILPGGSQSSARLHLARSVCRRAERSVLCLSEQQPLRNEILRYLNRLSDWLFVAARTCNARESVSDVAWIKKEQN